MNGASVAGSAFVVTWLTASLRLAGPVLLAALGETFAEQSGVLNVGIEGTMLLGALASFLVSLYTGMIWFSLLAAILIGIAASLFLAWMYVTVRASQVVAGLVFNVFEWGDYLLWAGPPDVKVIVTSQAAQNPSGSRSRTRCRRVRR